MQQQQQRRKATTNWDQRDDEQEEEKQQQQQQRNNNNNWTKRSRQLGNKKTQKKNRIDSQKFPNEVKSEYQITK